MNPTEDTKLFRIGITASIAVHLILALLATWYVAQTPRVPTQVTPKPTPKVQLVFAKDLQLPPVEVAEVAPQTPATERYVRTTQNAPESAAPANATMVSDRNTMAASTLPGRSDGEPNLPTTRGIKDLPTMELANRDLNLGEALPEETAPPPPERAEVMETPEPASQRAENSLTIKPEETVAETPPAPRKARPVLDPPVLRDPSSDQEAFQPQTRTSQRDGAVNQPGLQNAVDARATPKGKYMRLVTSQIEKRWHFLRTKRGDFVQPSKLRLRFYVGRDGKIRPQDIFIVSNNANPVLTDFSIQAIMEATIPPMPAELLSQLDQERLEIEYDIVIY